MDKTFKRCCCITSHITNWPENGNRLYHFTKITVFIFSSLYLSCWVCFIFKVYMLSSVLKIYKNHYLQRGVLIFQLHMVFYVVAALFSSQFLGGILSSSLKEANDAVVDMQILHGR